MAHAIATHPLIIGFVCSWVVGYVMGRGSEKNAVAKAARRLSGKD